MNSAALGRAIRDAGKSFLSSRLGDLYDKRKELDTEEGFDKIAEGYFKKQVGHHDSNIEETKERMRVAKSIIDEDLVIECLEILSDNKGMKPEFRMKAKETLKWLGGCPSIFFFQEG